jgi:tetratricopeptide (TPR) repeat protein
MKKVFFPVFFVLIIVEIIQAQEETGNDIRLAYEYYRTKDYDKAEILFEKIFSSTGAKVYFTGYSNCLIEQAKYEQAEKEIKKDNPIFKNRNCTTTKPWKNL